MKVFLFILLFPFTNSPIGYRQLRWEDFKGKPIGGPTLARTCSGIVIEHDTAYAIFDSERSWTRTSDTNVLRHEQIHFNITVFWASWVNHILKYSSDSAFKKEGLIDYYLYRWDETEKEYDEGTDHGRNTSMQKIWEDWYPQDKWQR